MQVLYCIIAFYSQNRSETYCKGHRLVVYFNIYGGVRSVDCARLYYIIRIMTLSVIKQLHNLIMQKERQRSQNETDDVQG